MTLLRHHRRAAAWRAALIVLQRHTPLRHLRQNINVRERHRLRCSLERIILPVVGDVSARCGDGDIKCLSLQSGDNEPLSRRRRRRR